MAILNRSQIITPRSLAVETVHVPEWGGDVMVRALTGAERDEFEASLMVGRKGDINLANLRARFVSRCVVDEDGKPLFAPEDVSVLGEQPASALDRIFTVGRRLSGLSEQDVAELAKT